MATVIGARTRKNGAGAATSSSRMPCQRCRWIAAPALDAVSDQIPSTAAPSDAYSSVGAREPARNMK